MELAGLYTLLLVALGSTLEETTPRNGRADEKASKNVSEIIKRRFPCRHFKEVGDASVVGADFYQLREQHLANKTLFEDPFFPADETSIFYNSRPAVGVIEWKRPAEIQKALGKTDKPVFINGGASRFDVNQGALGDCWLVASIAAMPLRQDLLNWTVPNDQGFDDKYAGIFHFRFWRYGKKVDVVIDDRIPWATQLNKTVYTYSKDNEYWPSLLEKAYAKLIGNYESLTGGGTSEALEDFTGGIAQTIPLDDPPPYLWRAMFKSRKLEALMGCSVESKDGFVTLPNGIIKGHAYTITEVEELKNGTETIRLVRVRNPHGQGEWNGTWSDLSEEMKSLSDAQRAELHVTANNEGEFYMSFEDFKKTWSKVEICHLPKSANNSHHQKQLEFKKFEGEWIPGVNAGGCLDDKVSFARNPQYRVNLTDADENDEQKKAVLVVSLMQKYAREHMCLGTDFLSIGYAIYKVDDPASQPDPLPADYFIYRYTSGKVTFTNTRSVTSRFYLDPGVYVVVPSTHDPDIAGKFLLTIITEKPHTNKTSTVKP